MPKVRVTPNGGSVRNADPVLETALIVMTRKGITKKEVAKGMGMCPSTFSTWWNRGSQFWQLRDIISLYKFLGLNSADLEKAVRW